MFLSTVLLLFIFLLSKLLIANKQKRKLIERENITIRNLIQNIPSYKEKDTALIHLEEYPLSARQLEIVELVKKGKTNKEIGEILFISENTVKYHLKSIYDILGVGSRIELKHKIPQNQQPAIETLVS